MWKLIKRVLVATIIAVIGYSIYDYYRADLHTRPDMPEGAFSISYKNGLRAILVNVPNERDTRRYFGTPMEVPFYLKDAWSFCSPPNAIEKAQANEVLSKRDWPGERFDVVCRITVDDKVVIRGLITFVPRL